MSLSKAEDEISMDVKSDHNFQNSAEEFYDVIVVGAGIAGLTAAYTLKKKADSLKILILEARNRVGGRTFTVDLKCSEDNKTAKWDLGGQWVTDTQVNITRLLKEFNLETYIQFDTGKKVLEACGKVVTYSSSIPNVSYLSLFDLQLMLNKINWNSKKISTLRPFENIQFASKMDSMNLEQWLFSSSFNATSRAMIEAAARTIFGLEMSQVNALFAATFVKSAGSFEALALANPGCAQEKKIKGGAQQVSEKLLESVVKDSLNKIIYNAETIEIKQENDSASVSVRDTKSGKQTTFRAKKVVSAIPLNLLTKVNFEPDLPAHKTNVLRSIRIGNYGKVIITYKNAFWKNNGYSGEVVSDGSVVLLKDEKNNTKDVPTRGPISVMYDASTCDENPALVGFLTADGLVQWFDQDAEVRKNEVIEHLVRYFGDEARDYLEYAEKLWNDEKFTGGCPVANVGTPGCMKDYPRALREPFMNVHFCGTDTATVWQGYMDGAVESGERAANEILFNLFKDDESVKVDFDKTFYFQNSA